MPSMTLQSKAYTGIRQGIIRSTYVPGSKLSIRELCDELGVGRTPVREAIVRLQHEGLVNVVPQSGSHVSKIDLHAAEATRFIREHLESKIAIECCARIDASQADALRGIIRQQEEAVSTHDVAMFFEGDNALHRALYVLAGYGEIWDWLEVSSAHCDRLRWISVEVDIANWRYTLEQHRALVDAIIDLRPNEAAFQASNHMHNLLVDKRLIIERHREYFDMAAGTSALDDVRAV